MSPQTTYNCKQKALRRFQIDPQKSIALAKDGSLHDMEVIANNEFGLSELIPHALLPALFDMLCSHLRNTSMRPYPTPSDVAATAIQKVLIKSSLLGLSHFEPSFLQNNTECIRIFREVWPGILVWLRRIGQPEIWPLPPHEETSLFYLNHILDLTKNLGILDELCGTKEFLMLITPMWLRNDWKEEPGLTTSECFLASFCLQEDLLEATGAVEQIMCQDKHRTSQAFELLFRRLRSASEDHIFRNMDIEFNIFHHLIMNSSRLRSGFIRAHGMTELIKTLRCISTYSCSTLLSQKPNPMTVTCQCFSIIVQALKTPRSTPALIKESLDQGLLDVMLCIAQGEIQGLNAVDVQGYDYSIVLIHRFYSSVCSIPTIADYVTEAYRKAVIPRVPFSNIDNFKYLKTWSDFGILLMERMVLKALNAQRRKRLKCDNPGCFTIGDKGIFQTCASCKEVLYCSHLCQKAAWKRHGHKKLCRTHRYRNSSMLRSNADSSFVKELAIIEVSRHAKSMYEQAKKNDPESLNAVFGFRVDFVQFPPDISFIYPLNESDSDDASDEPEVKYRDICRRIVMNGEHRGGTFIEIRVPTGGDKYDTLMCMGDVEKPNHDGPTPYNRPGKVAEILRLGKAVAKSPRRACTGSRGPLRDPLTAEYDELDEISRRVKSFPAQHFSDDYLIDVAIKQYLKDINDSTLGRYS